MEIDTQIEKMVELCAMSIVPIISTTAIIFTIIPAFVFSNREFKNTIYKYLLTNSIFDSFLILSLSRFQIM